MKAFGVTTTAEEVAQEFRDQIKGKTVLVTGVSPGGLGAVFLEAIVTHGPKLLILAGRDRAKGQETAKRLAELSPTVETRILELDLASQDQVRRAAGEVNAYDENIDVLVNNAAVMASPYWTTVDGVEGQFGTNHIGHFLFTNLIIDKILTAGPGARVVSVSSDGHRFSPVRFDDYGFEDGKSYHKWKAYGQAKTANMLFAVSLAEKLGPKGLLAYSVHPGVIPTNLARHMDFEKDIPVLKALDIELRNKQATTGNLDEKNLSQGAATHVAAAFDPSIADQNGAFLSDCHVTDPEDIKPYALDKANAEKLWALSESIVGEKFTY